MGLLRGPSIHMCPWLMLCAEETLWVHLHLFGGIILGRLSSSREIYAESTSHSNGPLVFVGSSMQKINDGEMTANWIWNKKKSGLILIDFFYFFTALFFSIELKEHHCFIYIKNYIRRRTREKINKPVWALVFDMVSASCCGVFDI